MTQEQNGAQQTQALTLSPLQERALATREQMTAAEPMAIVPRTFAEAMEFAKVISSSSLVPQALRDNAPNTMMMICAGAEIHVPPIASMRIFHVIEGVPKLSADGIAAICSRHSSCEYLEFEEMTPTRVTWIAKKKGRPEKRLTVTREEMIAAGLYDRKNRDGSPGNHQKYPRQMLNARCKAELCRLVWPDICAGMISAEEMADELGLDAYAKENAIDVPSVERKRDGFAPLPTNTSAPKPSAPLPNYDDIVTPPRSEPTPTLGPDPSNPPTYTGAPTTEPTPAGPLTDEELLDLLADLTNAKTPRDVSAVAKRIEALTKAGRATDAQYKQLADSFSDNMKRARAAGAKP